jgi:hypothetical protein
MRALKPTILPAVPRFINRIYARYSQILTVLKELSHEILRGFWFVYIHRSTAQKAGYKTAAPRPKEYHALVYVQIYVTLEKCMKGGDQGKHLSVHSLAAIKPYQAQAYPVTWPLLGENTWLEMSDIHAYVCGKSVAHVGTLFLLLSNDYKCVWVYGWEQELNLFYFYFSVLSLILYCIYTF